MKKILVIQTAFLGDVILATPLASELNRLFPNAKIDFLVKKGNETLLTGNPFIQTVRTFEKKNGKIRSILQIIFENRRIKYDIILNLHRFGSSGLITVFSRAKETRGFSKNPFSLFYTKKYTHRIGDGTHEVTRNLQLIEDFGAADIVRPSLFPSEQDHKNVKHFQRETYFCLAPASVWFTKQLPKEKWIELGVILSQKGKVYLLGAASDLELCTAIQEKISNDSNLVENLAGKLSLLESAALMAKATRNYVNDSGPLHISSAMNSPTTSFFCSTSPTFGFGPLADSSNVVESKLELACKPCGLHGFSNCPKGDFECGKSISISEIVR